MRARAGASVSIDTATAPHVHLEASSLAQNTSESSSCGVAA